MPDHVSALFALGRQLARRGDSEGVALIERAMEQDPAAVAAGCRILAEHFDAAGQPELAERYAARRSAVLREEAAVKIERERVLPGDPLVPHGFPPEVIAPLVAQLAAERDVVRAFMARKTLANDPSRDPVCVLALALRETPGRAFYKALSQYGLHELVRSGDPGQAVIARLRERLRFREALFLMIVDGDPDEMAISRAVRAIPQSEIFRRGRTVVAPAPADGESPVTLPDS
jgi:hypothetical protein